jgi:hypothetical protein
MNHVLRAVLIVSAFCLAGCATSDYGRITNKIAEYDADAARARARISESNSDAVKIAEYATLVEITRKQVTLAKRINLQSNPEFRSGKLNYNGSSAEKQARVDKYQGLLEQYSKEREALVEADTKKLTTPAAK